MDLIKETAQTILLKKPSREELEEILVKFENKVKESLIIDILIEKRNKKITEICGKKEEVD